jgi:DNA-binding winged helix-turn-helix (wHTH) protein/tetratricopeptide (TPR) repeat protein
MIQGDATPSPQGFGAASSRVRYRFEQCEVDPAGYRLLVRGEPIAIEPRVLELVVYLIEHRARVVSKDELLERLWAGKYVTESTLTRAVYEARRALGDDSREQRIIKTLHSRGYQFVATLIEDSSAGSEEAKDLEHPQPSSAAPLSSTTPEQPERDTRIPRARRWWPVALALAVIALIGVVVGTWYRGTAQPVPRERIAIMPFSVDANASDLGWAELGLPGLLAETLDQRANMIVFPANRVRQALLQRGVALDAPQEEQVRALRDVFGVDHVLFAHVGRERAQLQVGYDLLSADGHAVAGTARARGAGSLAIALARTIANEIDVAYEAGVPLRKIGSDEFVNEAFARGLQAQLGGQLEDSVRYFEVCLSNDPSNGWAQYELGNSFRLLSRWPEAAQAYEAARTRGAEDGDPNLDASAATGLGLLAWRQGRLDEAERYFDEARAKFEAIDRRANLAAAYGNLGILADNRRDYVTARRYYERALALYLTEGERAGESAVYSNLAVIERKLGNMDAAATLQRRAVDLQRRIGLNQMLVFSLAHLGEIERERGRWNEARAAIDESLQFAQLARDRLGEADALAARAALARDFERLDDAATDLRAAYSIYEDLGNPAGLARTALRLIDVTKTGAPAEARALAEKALSHARQLEDEPLALEIELVRAELDASDLGPLLPRLQTLGDHRLLALSWALRARRDANVESLRAALAHAERADAKRLQAELAVELARLMMVQGAPSSDIEPLLARADTWQPAFPATLTARACHLARTQRVNEAKQVWARASSLLGKAPDLSWCPNRSPFEGM